ncbi:MAG: type II toxin-antitoxin system Phd/YefM family antitoxin [Mycobacteriales bacterium]
MQTIGLRELNRNPSRAVSRVRAGESLVVTDRGKPVLQMVPVTEPTSLLEKLIAEGHAQPPSEWDMPEVIDDLSIETASLSDLLIAERNRERRR